MMMMMMFAHFYSMKPLNSSSSAQDRNTTNVGGSGAGNEFHMEDSVTVKICGL